MNKLILCNQKCYLKNNTVDLFLKELGDIDQNNIIFFPSFPYIYKYIEKGYNVGSQNVAPYNIKSLTGEINASQLYEMGVKYCIVGHSERRRYTKEDNKQINRKIKLLIKKGIIPVLCIGESQKEYDEGVTSAVIKSQLEYALNDIEELKKEQIIFAYEPVWSIGTGKNPTNSEILKAIAFIKKELKDRYHEQYDVVYGGSVNIDNLHNLNKIEMLDGYLIGSVSTKAEELKGIIKNIK